MTAFAIFETASLADAAGRASRIAPTKGTAFDKASGLVLILDPQRPNVAVVKTTNMEVSWREEITVLEMGDEKAAWRLPAQLFSSVMATLPIGTGKNTRLEEVEGRRLILKASKKKMRVAMMTIDTFPPWDAFDPEGMGTVTDLGLRIKQASWAVGQTPPWSGIHIDGERLVATDKYKAVVLPCRVPVDKPITVPAAILGPVLKEATDMKARVAGRELHLMPDDYTQIRTVIFDVEFPPWDKFSEILKTDQPYAAEVDRAAFSEKISQALVLGKQERMPSMRMDFEDNELRLFITSGTDELEDILEIEYEDKPFTIHVTPNNLKSALDAADSPRVKIRIGPTDKSIIYVSDSKEYQAWCMPRAVT